MTDNVTDINEHKARLCQQADFIIADAMRLRLMLKQGISLPFPDKERDALMLALATFVSAAQAHPR